MSRDMYNIHYQRLDHSDRCLACSSALITAGYKKQYWKAQLCKELHQPKGLQCIDCKVIKTPVKNMAGSELSENELLLMIRSHSVAVPEHAWIHLNRL